MCRVSRPGFRFDSTPVLCIYCHHCDTYCITILVEPCREVKIFALAKLQFYVITRITFYKWYLRQCLNALSKFISKAAHVVSATEDIFLEEGFFGLSRHITVLLLPSRQPTRLCVPTLSKSVISDTLGRGMFK